MSGARRGRAMSARIVRGLEIGMVPVLWIARKLFSIPPLPIPALWWKRIGLAIVSATCGVALWVRIHAPHETLDGATWNDRSSLAFWSGMAVVVTLASVALFAFDRLGVAALHLIARALPASGRGALAVARHTLESRRASSWTSGPTAKVGGEFSGLLYATFFASLLVANFTIGHAVAHQGDALVFDAAVVPAGNPAAGAAAGVGVDRAALDASVIAALEADPALAVVPYGQVTVGAADGSATIAAITLVSPGDLDRVVPGGARPLGLQDGVVLSPSVNDAFPAREGLIDVATGNGETTLFHRRWFGANTLATRAWGEATWGEVPIVGALVAYVGDDESVDGRFAYIASAAKRAGAEAQPGPHLSAEDVAYHRGETDYSFSAFGWLGIFMALYAGVFTIGFAFRTVRAHRQVRATVAALGATPRALALAVPIDTGITLALSFAIGAPVAGLASAFATHPTLLHNGGPLDPGATAWGLWWDLTHIAWLPLASFAVAAWTVSVIVSGVYGFAVARRTPVDELRIAIKEGAV